jgi:hypothetical protein
MDEGLKSLPDLRAALWRTRLIAFQQEGKLVAAAEALPRYVEADRDGAPATLRRLFEAMMREAESARDADQSDAAAAKAEVAVLLAEQLSSLARAAATYDATVDSRTLDVPLAEALILTRAYSRARDVAKPQVDAEAASAPRDEWDVRSRFALAEAQFGLGEFAAALPWFNTLATRLPASHPIRWRALVRDLQCRAALGQAPADIRKVIAQQRFLHPDLGGPARERELLLLEEQVGKQR